MTDDYYGYYTVSTVRETQTAIRMRRCRRCPTCPTSRPPEHARDDPHFPPTISATYTYYVQCVYTHRNTRVCDVPYVRETEMCTVFRARAPPALHSHATL